MPSARKQKTIPQLDSAEQRVYFRSPAKVLSEAIRRQRAFYEEAVAIAKKNKGDIARKDILDRADFYSITIPYVLENLDGQLTPQEASIFLNKMIYINRALRFGIKVIQYHIINSYSFTIDQKLQRDVSKESAAARFALLKEFILDHNGEGAEEYFQILFPELFVVERENIDPASEKMRADEVRSLPTEAPEIYQGLRGPETPPEFMKRVYAPWLGTGLTRAHIRHLDPKLSVAINNWLSRPGNEWPADVDLPTVKEQNDRWVDRLRAEGMATTLGPEASLKEFYRLQSAAGRRRGQSNEI